MPPQLQGPANPQPPGRGSWASQGAPPPPSSTKTPDLVDGAWREDLMESWPAAQQRGGEEGPPVVGSGVGPPPAPQGPKPWPRHRPRREPPPAARSHRPAGRGAFRSHRRQGSWGAPPALLRLRCGGCAFRAPGAPAGTHCNLPRGRQGALSRPAVLAPRGRRRGRGCDASAGRRGDGATGSAGGREAGRGRRDGQPVRPQEAEPRHGAGQGHPGEAGRAGRAGRGGASGRGRRVPESTLAGRLPSRVRGRGRGRGWSRRGGLVCARGHRARDGLAPRGPRSGAEAGAERVPGTSCPRRDLLPGPPVAMGTAMRSRFRGARGGSVSVGRGDVGAEPGAPDRAARPALSCFSKFPAAKTWFCPEGSDSRDAVLLPRLPEP